MRYKTIIQSKKKIVWCTIYIFKLYQRGWKSPGGIDTQHCTTQAPYINPITKKKK